MDKSCITIHKAEGRLRPLSKGIVLPTQFASSQSPLRCEVMKNLSPYLKIKCVTWMDVLRL